MFRPYMWAIFRLRFFNLQISYTRCVRRLARGRGRYLVISIVGTMTMLQVDFLVVYVIDELYIFF